MLSWAVVVALLEKVMFWHQWPILKTFYARKLWLQSHTWLENTPYYNPRVVIYERKMFIRLATEIRISNPIMGKFYFLSNCIKSVL